jgi:hypothetical protein
LGWINTNKDLDNTYSNVHNIPVREHPEWEDIMTWIQTEKKRRPASEYRVGISAAKSFILNSSAAKDIAKDFPYADIWSYNDGERTVKVAIEFVRKQGKNSYVVTHHKSAASISGKATLDGLRFNHKEHMSVDAKPETRNIAGKRREVLELEIDRKYFKK